IASEFADLVGPHELAHQWWGHLVGWRTYHDVWLSEGFAEFSASLVMQYANGTQRFNEFWDKRRRSILGDSGRRFIHNSDAGPISLGIRISSPQTPGAYQALVYSKGAYVLQMLRSLLWSPKERDAPFIALMKDFGSAWAGKNPSTRDFQVAVERHMSPAMD